jgi:hypothetical protein
MAEIQQQQNSQQQNNQQSQNQNSQISTQQNTNGNEQSGQQPVPVVSRSLDISPGLALLKRAAVKSVIFFISFFSFLFIYQYVAFFDFQKIVNNV